jgi:alkylation response protein AidB-like acyl-CoA dehydrogenase
MPIYKAPLEDVNFLLNDVFQIDRYDNLPGFSDASADVREAILNEAAKLSEEVLQPLNRVGDIEGCTRHDDGSVSTPEGFKEAFKQVSEGGWLGLSAPTEYGGQGLPVTLSQTVTEFQSSANMAFSMYGGLTMGATAALIVHGKPEQKTMFVPKMVAGQWTGTMNLTEPQCGTDLGLLRTKAVKQADGSYKITGTKIFISAGEHDMSENIIHLVIARIEGAYISTKGVLQILGYGVGEILEGATDQAQAAAKGLKETAQGISKAITSPWTWIGISAVVAVVGGGLLVYYMPRSRSA